MAAVRVLVDTDVLIDYFKAGEYAALLDDRRNRIYGSVVTRKELLAKEGLRDSERRAILDALARFRLVPLTRAIAERYPSVRRASPALAQEDAVIAATAIEKRLPLLTRNWRHFSRGMGVALYSGH